MKKVNPTSAKQKQKMNNKKKQDGARFGVSGVNLVQFWMDFGVKFTRAMVPLLCYELVAVSNSRLKSDFPSLSLIS